MWGDQRYIDPKHELVPCHISFLVPPLGKCLHMCAVLFILMVTVRASLCLQKNVISLGASSEIEQDGLFLKVQR